GLSAEQTEKIIEKMQAAFVPWTENSFPGMLPNVVAGRITNRLDLGGTNCVVDAACASSLSALKMAISELIEGRCDMMLTGGFDTDN
ncbi:beta-ketoacyl synthase N-terminal-like domain-containing protein, partial [Salmonella enterica]